jgi:aminopeptidase
MPDRIDAYADLIVRVGANVQPAQTVFVNALPEHVELARALARSAYRAGAGYVDVRYADPHVRRAMIELGPEEALTHTPAWFLERVAASEDAAVIAIAGEAEPELLADLDQTLVGRASMRAAMQKMLQLQNENATNWSIAAFPSAGPATACRSSRTSRPRRSSPHPTGGARRARCARPARSRSAERSCATSRCASRAARWWT